MAADAKPAPMANGTHSPNKPFELAITLPQSPGTKIHLHLTVLASSLMLFLTSASVDATQAGASMGSFVYAMPDRYNPSEPMSTPLYTLPSSLDFTTRMAKILARKTKIPCYVGSSINLGTAAGGGTVEEEMEAFRLIVDVAMKGVEKSKNVPEESSSDDDEED